MVFTEKPHIQPHEPHDDGPIRLVTNNKADALSADLPEYNAKRLHALLDEITALLRPAVSVSTHDDAMVALALSSANFVAPLSKNEVIVLACGLYMQHMGKSFDYNDVLALTHRFSGRAMNTTTVYNTFRTLQDRRLVNERGREIDEKTERLSRSFGINTAGMEAFRLAIVNAHHLQTSMEAVAA